MSVEKTGTEFKAAIEKAMGALIVTGLKLRQLGWGAERTQVQRDLVEVFAPEWERWGLTPPPNSIVSIGVLRDS